MRWRGAVSTHGLFRRRPGVGSDGCLTCNPWAAPARRTSSSCFHSQRCRYVYLSHPSHPAGSALHSPTPHLLSPSLFLFLESRRTYFLVACLTALIMPGDSQMISPCRWLVAQLNTFTLINEDTHAHTHTGSNSMNKELSRGRLAV